MAEQNWKRKEYETWDEAFRGLAPAVRQQSVRVAAYTQVLFVQACADGYGKDSPDGAQEMDGQFADVAYKCGMYHQLGKALVPPEYQLWRGDFTAEETAVYRKYTSDGRQLIASLQERGLSAKERRTGAAETLETDNIPWRMQRESCQQHMERWDGSGYPEGRQGTDISPIARIVGLAKELDRLSAETKSEEPFGEAFDALCANGGVLWDSALIEVLRRCRSKCRDVYRKYIHYTMTLPKTIPLVDKRKDRVMGLHYRPMVAARDGRPVLYEAVPWFGGIAGRPGETESMDALADVLHRTEMTADVSFYLLYEAADALLRIRNCQLDVKAILMPLLPDFWRANHLQQFAALFDDQPVNKAELWLAVPAEYAAAAEPVYPQRPDAGAGRLGPGGAAAGAGADHRLYPPAAAAGAVSAAGDGQHHDGAGTERHDAAGRERRQRRRDGLADRLRRDRHERSDDRRAGRRRRDDPRLSGAGALRQRSEGRADRPWLGHLTTYRRR